MPFPREIMKKGRDRKFLVFGVVFALMVVGFFGFIIFSDSNVEAATGSVSCTIVAKSLCTGTGKTVVLGLSDLTNAHASKNNLDNYNSVLCCEGGTAITG